MKFLIPILAAVLFVTAVPAQDSVNDANPAIAQYNLEKNNLGIQGRDPVAYFQEGARKGVKGNKELTSTYRGVTYRFASEANRSTFAAAPERFAPRFGGWCAWAMAQGKKAEVDPDSFVIQGDRLYVFYKGFLNDTRAKWLKGEQAKLATDATREWANISGEGGGRSTTHFNLASGLALAGFDPVSYLPAGGSSPLVGKQELALVHDNVTYRFASEENMKLFAASPERFEPSYGGYCGWAMSQGKKVDVDPRAFVVDDHGLTLFYNGDKRDEWVAAGAPMSTAADGEWRALHVSR